MKIWYVDAFTEVPFKGNPAGVCIVKEFPTEKLMQDIASEVNFSETAFVMPMSNSKYHIRWFTPNSEAPLCGHATLAAAHILLQEGLEDISSQLTFKSLAGDLEVNYANGWINLNFPLYEVTPIQLTTTISKVINVDPIFTGFAHNCIFMEFNSINDLILLKPDLNLLSQLECRALIATADCYGTEYDFMSRYFAPKVGINEDPVCASAHCRLIPYWSKKLNKNELIAYQASSRGGIIKCKNLGNRVLISGKAVTVLEGELKLKKGFKDAA